MTEKIQKAWIDAIGKEEFESIKNDIDNDGKMIYDYELYGECRDVFEMKEMRDTSPPFEKTYFIKPKSLNDHGKTPEEIEALKKEWAHDPIWDIYETEGFEEHREELKKFQDEYWAEAKAERQEELKEFAEKIGIPGNTKLAEYIQFLESKIDRMKDQLNL